jgi:hypothetical protein
MKRVKNIKGIIYVIVCFSVLLSSCLNESGPFADNGDYGIVELDLSARLTATPYAIRNISRGDAATIEIPVVVNYTGVSGTPEAVNVTLGIYNEAVTAYAESTSTIAELLPSGSYVLPASNVVTIARGEKRATYTIQVDASLLDPDVTIYGIGVRILDASGGRISGNYSTGVYRLLK